MLRFSIGGIVMAALHVALLAITATRILAADAQQWPRLWNWFLALDFPLSLGVVPLAWIFPASPAGPLHDFANFWWPLGYHGIIGTTWWYIVGTYIADKLTLLWQQRRRSAGPRQ